jgi:hypothetical protein
MDFKEATDNLFDRVDHETLANRLSVSIATIRQARLKPEAEAHRSPPGGWRSAVTRIAEERIGHYRKLIERLHEHEVPQ